jgi:hypothetical protein
MIHFIRLDSDSFDSRHFDGSHGFLEARAIIYLYIYIYIYIYSLRMILKRHRSLTTTPRHAISRQTTSTEIHNPRTENIYN